ncbi:MAG TPA: glycoside hydrolase family 3 N-terminal domain-containing protein [Treponemataceae bacterium]|nr:glycoside hydrolase family 3 N-terminal domain-containing protein [Treponemataceae bacterium]
MKQKKIHSLPALLIGMVFLFLSCNNNSKNSKIDTIKYSQIEWREREISLILSNMSLQEKASQVLMTGIDGKKTFLQHSYTHFADSVPGAILLFRYNLADSPLEVKKYLQSCTTAFSQLGSSIPVFFAIDNEGGSVFRTSGLTSILPSSKKVAEFFSPLESHNLYRIQGQQLKALGITMNLAPVSEIQNADNTLFLGTRTFGKETETVVMYSKSSILGYRESKIISVVKHFPGNSSKDPHLQLPVLNISKEKFETEFIPSFKLLFSSVAVDAVLVSHIVVPAIDSELPFCLSSLCVTDYLRNKLGFSGLILTDDISMPALTNSGYSSSQAAIMALNAGCDMIMTSATDIHEIINAIKLEAETSTEFSKRLNSAVFSILTAKYKAGIITTSLQRYSKSRYIQRENISQFNSEEYKDLYDAGQLLVEEMYGRNR